MDSANSALRLERSFYDRVVVEANGEYKPEGPVNLHGQI